MEAEGNAARGAGPGDRAGGEVERLEHPEFADILRAVVGEADDMAVALGRVARAGDEDRLADAIAGGQFELSAPAGGEIDMGDGVEPCSAAAGAGGEPAVAIGEAGAALVESRELAGKIVQRLAAYAIAGAGEVDAPANEARLLRSSSSNRRGWGRAARSHTPSRRRR